MITGRRSKMYETRLSHSTLETEVHSLKPSKMEVIFADFRENLHQCLVFDWSICFEKVSNHSDIGASNVVYWFEHLLSLLLCINERSHKYR